ncbi:unnamed protein product [Adineta steineri]|uniref:Uncharacterized protein n=1 Tax=Adineta steineri TaxID=433720 RepID=A0A815QNN8_9BILA|nr:unnamed protein product [Adineta steineri]CAF1634394.1 unnamed protein product [Adineta steineri]
MAERPSLPVSVNESLMAVLNEIGDCDINFESHELRSSYPNTVTISDVHEISTIDEEYQIRTLGQHNMARMSILPTFPPNVSQSSPTIANLLLANVSLVSLTQEQYERAHFYRFPKLFKLKMNLDHTQVKSNDDHQTSLCNSFLLCFYDNLYRKLKKRLNVGTSILDFNLTRLRQCIDKVVEQRGQRQTMLSIDELPLALEFYLQIDVDMFFLKTCSFNGVQLRQFEDRILEGLFCLDKPEARFVMKPCNKSYCHCCHSPCPRRNLVNTKQRKAIQFSTPHIHRFVNQYEAILNCPATCESNNCIYVLTCPCGQVDFIGSTKEQSFAEIMALHREEGNRIIRECLVGQRNINLITNGFKSEEQKLYDKLWLYQHSSRCPDALQLFLDYNPAYWCFVPMKSMKINMTYTPIEQASFVCASNETSWSRTDDEVLLLIENLPKPLLDFQFSADQYQQQTHFFKSLQDFNVPRDHVDLYNADIIAILPDNCSELFTELIESLLITHAECKLNEFGHLVYEPSDPNGDLHDSWCINLIRRHSQLLI